MRATTYKKNNGLRKVCACSRRKWPLCEHAYYLNYSMVRVGSLDREAGRHLWYDEAVTLANAIRTEIDEHRFVPRRDRKTALARPALETPAPDGMTVDALGDRYFGQARNRLTGEPLTPRVRQLWTVFADFAVFYNGDLVRLGGLPAAAVTAEHVRAFYEQQAVRRPATVKNGKSAKGTQKRSYTRMVGGPVSANRTGDRAATVYKWAAQHPAETGVLRSPFSDNVGERLVAKHGELGRDRRLEPGEEEALLKHAPPHLRLCIIAALESMLRVGELLALRWKNVDCDAGCIRMPGRSTTFKTKTRKGRVVPLTARMLAVLTFLRVDADGQPHPGSAFVFGDGTTGEKLATVKTAWTTCRLRAFGFTGQIREPETSRVTAAAKAALKAQDLKWHDLRRESASAHVDRGMRLPEVQQVLGHGSLATTSRYVKPKPGWMQDAIARVDQHPESVENLKATTDLLTAAAAAQAAAAVKAGRPIPNHLQKFANPQTDDNQGPIARGSKAIN